MTPEEQRRWIGKAREVLRFSTFGQTDGFPFIAAALLRIEREAGAPVVFLRLGESRWTIHPEGQPPQTFHCVLVGLEAAWRAIDAGRAGSVPAAQFAGPSLRRAIRSTAAGWVERTTGLVELAAALRCISVAAGQAQYRPTASAPRIITR